MTRKTILVKNRGSIEDVNISAMHWTEFTEELKLYYFLATARPTHNLLHEFSALLENGSDCYAEFRPRAKNNQNQYVK